MKFNPELNVNTALTAVAIGVICYVGKLAVNGQDEITKLTVQQSYLVKSAENFMPRTELDLKLEALKVEIQAVRVQVIAVDAELIKVKQLMASRP